MGLLRYLGLIGLAVFLFIIYSIGPMQIAQTLLQSNPFLLLAVLLIIITGVLIKAWRQCILLSAFDARLPLLDSANIWLMGFFFSIITPGKSGDLVKGVYFSKKPGIPIGKGLAVTVVERFFDVAVLFVFALVGFAALSMFLFFQLDLIFPIFIFFVGFILLGFLLSKKDLVSFFIKPFYGFFIPKRFVNKLQAGFDHFFEAVDIYKTRKIFLLKVASLTVIVWVITIVQYYLVALALGIDISFLYLFAIMPIVNIISSLPIAFGGIGTREASLVFFFGLIGLSPSSAVSFALVILLFNLLLAAVGFLGVSSEKEVKI